MYGEIIMKSKTLKNVVLLSYFSCSALLAITVSTSSEPEPETLSCNQFTDPEKCKNASTYCHWDSTSQRCVELVNEE